MTEDRKELVARLTRPIIGIENRTAQEAFDIMADRFRHALHRLTADRERSVGEDVVGEDVVEAEAMARRFHEAYERLAPSFGYETRAETRHFDPTTPNGKLMVAVCGAIAATPSCPFGLEGTPEGFVLVPKAPTEAMQHAGQVVQASAGLGTPAQVWSAMIAAAVPEVQS